MPATVEPSEFSSSNIANTDFTESTEQEVSIEEINIFLRQDNDQLPKIIRQLTEIGKQNFKNDAPLKDAYKHDISERGIDSGRFRQKLDWVSVTFGMTEDQLIEMLTENFNSGELESPKPWSIQKIQDDYARIQQLKNNQQQEMPLFILVQGVGVSGLHYSEYSKNAIVQFASQFNYLESPNLNISNPSQYPNDRTQGPLGVIEAAAATYLRHVAVITNRLPHGLHNVLPEGAPYKNGYFEPARAGDKEALAQTINQNLNRLEILPQWVVNEASNTQQIHVFSAAPSYQGIKQPDINSAEGQLCTDIVATQYEAIAKLAVIRSALIGKNVNLHLTLIGQSAFNNPKEVMIEAFKRVAQIVKGFNVRVFVHLFSKHDADSFTEVNKSNIDGHIFSTSKMTKDQFFSS